MPDEQLTEIFAAICGSLDDVEQGRSNFEHITYEIVREKGGDEEVIHVIIIRTSPNKEEEEEQH